MNVYKVNDYSQHHCVVAESFAKAEKMWKKYYDSEIEKIELYSKYVLIQGEDNG